MCDKHSMPRTRNKTDEVSSEKEMEKENRYKSERKKTIMKINTWFLTKNVDNADSLVCSAVCINTHTYTPLHPPTHPPTHTYTRTRTNAHIDACTACTHTRANAIEP